MKIEDDDWLQDASGILGDSNESLSICAKILCLLYGLAHASDDFYAFTSQSIHSNLEQRSVYKSTLLFFLGAGVLFEVLIGTLERSEQLATNDKPLMNLRIRWTEISPVKGIFDVQPKGKTCPCFS